MKLLNRSVELFRSIGLDPLEMDGLILHALEVIGAISCISGKAVSKSKIESTKLRIFWKTVQHITSHQLDEKKEDNRFYERCSTNMVLTAFPDKQKYTDGRMWLPMHWAVAVPGIEVEDIRVLLTDQPNTLSSFTTVEIPYSPLQQREISVTPCHLAVMTKTPNIYLIELFKMFKPNFGTLLASDRSTPLHLAAEFSNSVALIQQLIQLNPQALELRNMKGDLPLSYVSRNRYPTAPEMLKALIDATPQTNRLPHYDDLPLHRLLTLYHSDRECDYVDAKIKAKLVLVLVEAFPNSVNIPGSISILPIHLAARVSSVDILKIITEANPENLSMVHQLYGTVAHCTVCGASMEKIRYLHTMMPELLHTMDQMGQTPLHIAIDGSHLLTQIPRHLRTNTWNALIEEMANLAPKAARKVDINGNNLLHTIAARTEPIEHLIRFFLRLIPGGALATNNQGQTPYDLLTPNHPDYNIARRLLLLAGAPSLHPETRKQMNYQARKGALFAFFAGAFEPNIFYRIRDSGAGRVIMRQVVSFL